MKRYPSAGQVHWFDTETGGLPKHRSLDYSLPEFLKWSRTSGTEYYSHPYATFHANAPLLQLYATGLPHFQSYRDANERLAQLTQGITPTSSLIRTPSRPWVVENGDRVPLLISDWARKQGLTEASAAATRTEEESLRFFFEDLEGKIAAESGPVHIGGWNIGYDLTAIERSARRYGSLSQYHGWLGGQIEAGKLNVVEGFDVFADSILEHARRTPGFAESNLRMFPSGKIATTPEELRLVPGWKLGNIIEAIGGTEAFNISSQAAKFHGAFFDTEITAAAYTRLQEAHAAIAEGMAVDEAFTKYVGANTASRVPGVFQKSGWQKQVQRAIQEGTRETGIGFESVRASRNVLIGAAALGGLAIAAGLAFSKRRDRQTQITGLNDLGLAADNRHQHSDFGSGWRGLDGETPSYNLSTLMAMGGAASGFHYWISRHPQHAFKWISFVEQRFPHKLLNYFGFSQFASSYLPGKLDFERKLVLDAGGNLTYLGEHFQRLLKGADLQKLATGGLHFERQGTSPYLRLQGTDFSVRFLGYDPKEVHGGSRWAGASSRWGTPINQPDRYLSRPPAGDTSLKRWQSAWKQTVLGQTPINPKYGVEADSLLYQPFLAEREGRLLANLRQKAGVTALEIAEQPQKLFARIGLGIKNGSWNSAHGLVGNLLIKRALPVAAGILAVDYADYLTGHRLSSAVLGLGPKANLARAELTDRVPGARKTTDWYKHRVPGPQWGPIALPLAGMVTGEILEIAHDTVTGVKMAGKARNLGLKMGLAAMLPFLPGMLGSRKTTGELRDVYSGKEPVPVRSGRWWWLNQTPWQGGRIIGYRAHWLARMQSRPERVALYGSEEEYWRHNPILHPLRWLRNPYALEEATYGDRPYPMSSPAFSNVPLVGPLLAATLGRLVKPPRRMHEEEWNGDEYTLFSPRVEPRGPQAVAPPTPKEEFGLRDILNRETEQAAEFSGLSGFLAKTLLNKARNNTRFGKDVYYEGSRQMTSWSRHYYDESVGAGMGPDVSLGDKAEYSEPLRRFIQRDLNTLQANEIPNHMPHWMPGNDYMLDFHTGDPYAKVSSGASRIPGPGYEALHPELKDVPYEQYPDIERFKILSDVAPWSKEWFVYNTKLNEATLDDPQRRIEYEQVRNRAQALKDSSEEFQHRRFTEPVEEITGVVKRATPHGLELENGRKVQLSALGTRMADLSSIVLGEQNDLSRAQVATEANARQRRLIERMSGLIGKQVRLVVPEGTSQHTLESRAVVFIDGQNLNRDLIASGLAREDESMAGAEYQAMSGTLGKLIGKAGEAASFLGDQDALNPQRWTWGHEKSKFWGSRTPIERYRYNELQAARIQRWETPFKSFANPWLRSLTRKLTGRILVPGRVQEERDLDQLVDTLKYLRATAHGYTNKTQRTAVGADVTADPLYLRSTLSGRDKFYFPEFLRETSDAKRQQILESVPADFGRILQGQWVKQDLEVAAAAGQPTPQLVTEGGRLLIPEDVDAYEKARHSEETQLDFGNWQRSSEIAAFFARKGIRLPEDPDSPLYDENIDYQDVKAKIVQEEGLDYHDFNIFDDRAALLWRKPYLDGAVRELTAGGSQPVEELRATVERMILARGSKEPDVRVTATASPKQSQNLKIRIHEDSDEEILRDVRRNPEMYRNQETYA